MTVGTLDRLRALVSDFLVENRGELASTPDFANPVVTEYLLVYAIEDLLNPSTTTNYYYVASSDADHRVLGMLTIAREMITYPQEDDEED